MVQVQDGTGGGLFPVTNQEPSLSSQITVITKIINVGHYFANHHPQGSCHPAEQVPRRFVTKLVFSMIYTA